jgi:hypothetical protein
MSEVDPLLAAVEALTKPVTTGFPEKDAQGRWRRVHEVHHDPLLKQMRDAVWPSGENNGGASASANERIPLDSHMLVEYAKIASQIKSWAVRAGYPPSRDTITDLNHWYLKVSRDRDFDPTWSIRTLEGWEAHIIRLLAKPKSFVIEAPCPICGATEWGERIHGGGMWPIKVEYVLDETDHMKDESALCQVCRTLWDGHDSVMELAEELSEKGTVGA